jgi:hypothetical protein
MWTGGNVVGVVRLCKLMEFVRRVLGSVVTNELFWDSMREKIVFNDCITEDEVVLVSFMISG